MHNQRGEDPARASSRQIALRRLLDLEVRCSFKCLPFVTKLFSIDFNLIRERPPGLIQHVLTVLVFWSWVLLRPRLLPSPRSLKLFPWPSILLHGPLDICLDLLPAAPRPPMQKRDAQHMFLQHRGSRTDLSGTGDSQRDSRESIRANRFARIIRNFNPYFYSASGRFARITRISDSRESPASRESCKSIRANHATKISIGKPLTPTLLTSTSVFRSGGVPFRGLELKCSLVATFLQDGTSRGATPGTKIKTVMSQMVFSAILIQKIKPGSVTVTGIVINSENIEGW